MRPRTATRLSDPFRTRFLQPTTHTTCHSPVLPTRLADPRTPIERRVALAPWLDAPIHAASDVDALGAAGFAESLCGGARLLDDTARGCFRLLQDRRKMRMLGHGDDGHLCHVGGRHDPR